MASAHGVDGDGLLKAMRDPKAKEANVQAFAEARAAGVTSYPAIWRREGEGVTPVLPGWAPSERVAAVLAG